VLRFIDIHLAGEKARSGDLDAAIELSRAHVDDELAKRGVDYVWPAVAYLGPAVTTLVEALLRRGTDADLNEAQTAIAQASSVSTDADYVLLEPLLLRLNALLARARGDETIYRDNRDQYRAMAMSLGFEGHIAWAEAMP
jgi:adenylate cyclase